MQHIETIPMQIIFLVLNIIWIVNSQTFDSTLCPTGVTVQKDPLWISIPGQFQIRGELVSSTDLMEITQTFSMSKDSFEIIHPVIGHVSFYWNYETNEMFDIYYVSRGDQPKPMCLRQVIDSTTQTSNIQPDTLYIKPSVLLGYDNCNQINPNWGVLYNGTSRIREIPANVFRSCFYISDIHATVSATYFISDPDLYHGYLPNNQPMVLQIGVSIISDDGPQIDYVYNIFSYITDLSQDHTEQKLDTPEHIFCRNRINSLPLPNNLPEQFRFNQERFLNTQSFTIKSEFNIFDRIMGISRLDSWIPMFNDSRLSRLIQLDDFATGLRYQYDQHKRFCSISSITEGVDAIPIDPQSNLLEMVDPSQFFFRNNITYQYVGEKKCSDRVRCHVWIGEALPDNGTRLRREWYWAFEINGTPLVNWIPLRMISKTLTNNDNLVNAYETNLLNFVRDSSHLDEIDQIMVNCYRSMGLINNFTFAVIEFTVANDQEYDIQKNIHTLQNSIRETLAFLTEIRSTRISNIIINFEVKSFSVMLTLLDALPYLGPVESPLTELPLTDIITHLRKEIDANNLIIRGKHENNEFQLPVQANSLRVIYNGFVPEVNSCVNQTMIRTAQVDECPNITTTSYETVESTFETNYKTSGPLITGVWIGFVILGVFIGLMGGTFVLTKLSK